MSWSRDYYAPVPIYVGALSVDGRRLSVCQSLSDCPVPDHKLTMEGRSKLKICTKEAMAMTQFRGRKVKG